METTAETKLLAKDAPFSSSSREDTEAMLGRVSCPVLAIADELRALRPGLEVHWLARPEHRASQGGPASTRGIRGYPAVARIARLSP